MRNQSSRLRNATVAGGSGDPILRKSRPFWIFFFSPLHNTIHRRLLWNSPLIFIIFFPCTSYLIIVVVVAVVVVVVNEKTFNWGEKRKIGKIIMTKGLGQRNSGEKWAKKRRRGLVSVSVHRVTATLPLTYYWSPAWVRRSGVAVYRRQILFLLKNGNNDLYARANKKPTFNDTPACVWMAKMLPPHVKLCARRNNKRRHETMRKNKRVRKT